MVPCTSQAATAIWMYRSVHTGPKSLSGGVQAAFRSLGYQVFRADTVKTPPTPAAHALAPRNPSSHARLLPRTNASRPTVVLNFGERRTHLSTPSSTPRASSELTRASQMTCEHGQVKTCTP